MSMFAPPPAPRPLPPDLQQAVVASVAKFETRLRDFGILGMAQACGFIDEYRAELEAITRKAMQCENS